eukprot:CAMPEP_0203754440 /NCGR_PEP_ID=MMETSP0098-20131031/8028_1 /ASSEMBLY_ACC=CAM_ASM_000208 /TAXON_ID=96639 /ORGANISM=" , Strain NY0313808BC1" /LENGTH=268 /DNA_ID=CAMNT_0050645443 /DNA_START=162 /DNA_END=971 /DNA_ORIENTATION=+
MPLRKRSSSSESDSQDKGEEVRNVMFSGNALKDKLAQVFRLDRYDTDEEDEEIDLSKEGFVPHGQQRLGIGGDVPKKTEKKDNVPKALASAAAKAKKVKTSAFDGVKSELRAWESASDSEDRGDDDGVDSKIDVVGSKKRKIPAVNKLIQQAMQAPPSKKSKTKKKQAAKEAKKTEPALKKETTTAEPVLTKETKTTKPAFTKKAKKTEPAFTKETKKTEPSFRKENNQGPPFKRSKSKKKRSKQKNIKKDNRPEGTWKKNLASNILK